MPDPLTQRPTNQTVFEALLHLLGMPSAKAQAVTPPPPAAPEPTPGHNLIYPYDRPLPNESGTRDPRLPPR